MIIHYQLDLHHISNVHYQSMIFNDKFKFIIKYFKYLLFI